MNHERVKYDANFRALTDRYTCRRAALAQFIFGERGAAEHLRDFVLVHFNQRKISEKYIISYYRIIFNKTSFLSRSLEEEK